MTDIKPLPLAEGCPVGRCFFMLHENRVSLKVFTEQDTSGMIPENISGFVDVEIVNPSPSERISDSYDCRMIVKKVTKTNIIIARESGKTFVGGNKTKQIPVSNFYGASPDLVLGNMPIKIESSSAFFNDTDKLALKKIIDTFIKEIIIVVIKNKKEKEAAFNASLKLFEEAKKIGDIFNDLYKE